MTRQKDDSRTTVTVEIAGERHVLRSDAPAEYTQAVASHVDATISQFGPASSLEPHRTAILAALFITDELFRARAEAAGLRKEMERRAEQVAERLQAATAKAEGADPVSD
ncbi:MAG TPA: cell division protein ZapA [Longimicrobiaceae bacterium]|nr:cell division protein ZapA [Longimicrobiaceae bacterium]